MDSGLGTADGGLGIRHGLRCKTQTADKMRPTDCELGMKHGPRYKMPIFLTRDHATTLYEENGVFAQ